MLSALKRIRQKPEFRNELSYLYNLTDGEHRKNGKLDMSVGTSREKDLFAVLTKHSDALPIKWIDEQSSMYDGFIGGEPVSVKHKTSDEKIPTFKVKWTSDKECAEKSISKLTTDIWTDHILFVQIGKNKKKIRIIFFEAEQIDRLIKYHKVFKMKIFKTKNTGENDRGVEFSMSFMQRLMNIAIINETFEHTYSGNSIDPIQRRMDLLGKFNA